MSSSININHDNLNEVPTGEAVVVGPPIDPASTLAKPARLLQTLLGFTRIFLRPILVLELVERSRVYDIRRIYGDTRFRFWIVRH